MKDSKPIGPFKGPEIFFVSFFGVGFLPYAPGTWGTLATLPFLYLLGHFQVPILFFLPFLIIMTIISCFVTDIVQKKFEVKDPSWIVIDEVLGMAVTWLFVASNHWTHLLLLFGLFRFFDIVKMGPVKFLDQKVKNGAGTILDDLLSGVFAGLTYQALLYLYNLAIQST